ncbi:MAG: hypothetical protein DSY47_05575 [Hydrogenothermus sp.]|nr:MAG: hypothetical protein DSY47_05575 [Hydrogenothermus sp.]
MAYPRFIGEIENDFAFLKEDELKHAKVRRIKEGYKIEINDLKGNIFLAQVEEISKRYLKAKILEKLPSKELNIKINLFLAVPNKPSKIDDLIEPISQLGAYSLTPVITKTSALKEKDISKKLEKWKKIALNSIKQCERLYPLVINEPIKLKDIPKTERNFLFFEREENNTLKEFLGDKAENINILVGNEGGFVKEEVELLIKKDYKTVSLGEHILTMETAVISAICQTNFVYCL